MTARAPVAIVAAIALAGCGLLFEDPGPPEPRADVPPEERSIIADPEGDTVDAPIPAGYGTLRQEQIAVRLRHGELDVYVIPLDEGVIRTAAPDTWERLSALAVSHRSWFRDRTGSDAGYRLFLVALYTEAEPIAFDPDDLSVVSGGIRMRPADLRGVTPGWDRGELQPDDPQMAIYAFPPDVALDADLEIEYREVRSRDWARILQIVEAEQARIRARAGGR